VISCFLGIGERYHNLTASPEVRSRTDKITAKLIRVVFEAQLLPAGESAVIGGFVYESE
jgi:hypothetical protein